jgi:hypothetical protein
MLNVDFAYNEVENILFTSYSPGTVWETPEPVAEIFALYREKIREIGKKVIIVVDLANIHIALNPTLLDAISFEIKQIVADGYIYGFIRYNASDITTSTNVRVSSMRAEISSNIVFDREAALARARSLREAWQAEHPNQTFPETLVLQH